MPLFRLFVTVVLSLILITDPARAQADSWQALSQLKPEAVIAIYLKNGARMKQRFLGYDQDCLLTDVGEIARKDIAAISLFRRERLWDGTLRGGAIGAGTMMIPIAAYDEGSDGLAGAAVVGFLGGAGLGALYDAAVGKPDLPLYVNAGNETPSLRRWTLRVPHSGLARWVNGQQVQLMLKDGTCVRGKAVDGTQESLRIDVRESSDQDLHGKASIETAQIGTVTFRQKLGGNTGAAATAGAISGFLLGGVSATAASDNANEGAGIAVAALGGALAGGLLSGFGISQMNTREITLVVE